MPHLTGGEWLIATLGALCAGLSKGGFSGLGLISVIIFASIFGARDSTGIVLPLLIVADIGAVSIFRQHARWDHIRRTLPLAAAGVVIGTLIMLRLDNASFRPLLGGVILVLTALQLVRLRWPDLYGAVPHSRPVAWSLGLVAGITTMVANAAGPFVALYYVAVGLPKMEVVGTLAWFFFIINLFKVPFSAWIGVIHGSSLALDAVLVPAVILGLLSGRWLIGRISQRMFDGVLLAFAALAALRLML
ncbi:sulfite exporter TauE/SafE family protein [soil metagenome]